MMDLHNHTLFCNHASGSIDEYIQKAIEKGINFYGFSDHAPMEFDKKYRMDFSQIELYEKLVLEAKEKYKDKIEILYAYEVDFIEGLIDQRVLEKKVDYFIGSVHFLNKWGFDNPEFIGDYKNKDIDFIWEEYFNAIEKMAKSGHFDIVGHIDLIKIFKYFPKKEIKILANNAIKTIKQYNLTVEINTAGFRKPVAQCYPSNDILELLGQFDVPITFSSDAHSPQQVGFMLEEAKNLAKNYGYSKGAIFRGRDRELINF